jgi:hypothetical protein
MRLALDPTNFEIIVALGKRMMWMLPDALVASYLTNPLCQTSCCTAAIAS